ncbi:phosphatase PAP2 family protein [Peribacillus huizhouensis]|uniref:Undecaprenyl-diphosphatase n=1 Tax=Peribacillus huizhouensis TaxID=1501239 RepID=A0ABR6CLM1_9BACI|nr:phosphatase PAP2 family protein [Peribacillus huizhouensis]MBA9025257.1 undecaprenyl-diphosphatase [Peribacillus huizhouensis]
MRKVDEKNVPILLIVFFMCLAIYFIVSTAVQSGQPLKLDQAFLPFISSISGTWMYGFFYKLTEMGSTILLGVCALIVVVWLWIKKKDYLAMAVVSIGVAGSDQLNRFVKGIIERDRPSINAAIDAVGYSFPSGHAMVSITCYGLAVYFIGKHIKSTIWKNSFRIVLCLLVLLIGLSRIVLKAHYPTDVLAGYSLGGAIVIVCALFYTWFTNKGREYSKRV